MSYVSHIESAYGAVPITDGTVNTLAAGDFPQVHYDLPRIAREVDRDTIDSGPSSLWRYAALLPVVVGSSLGQSVRRCDSPQFKKPALSI